MEQGTVSSMERFSPHLISRCFVNVPFDRLQNEYLDFMLTHRLQPEIGLEGDFFHSTAEGDYAAVARVLQKAGLPCTLHAPFFDLAPGASDREIRRVSREKLHRAFELITLFKPTAVVCHLGYEENKHLCRMEEWFGHSLDTWRALLELAERHQTPIMLENTYETGPEQHRRLFEALPSPFLRFCLDTGHTLAFAKNSWRDWLPALSPWLGQLHLHDNKGDFDNHQAVGSGIFDFAGLFGYLREHKLAPLITLEVRSEEALWESFEAMDKGQWIRDNG
jgi:sugar phosphate isomerase/epimerase